MNQVRNIKDSKRSQNRNTHDDYQDPDFTESQIKEFNFNFNSQLQNKSNEIDLNDIDLQNNFEEVMEDHKKQKDNKINMHHKDHRTKESYPSKNYVISYNQCNIEYSPSKEQIYPWENKNIIMKNICHGFIDMLFGHKEEMESLKYEIQKLQTIIVENIHRGPKNKECNNDNDNNIEKKSLENAGKKPMMEYSIVKQRDIEELGNNIKTKDEIKNTVLSYHIPLDVKNTNNSKKSIKTNSLVNNDTNMTVNAPIFLLKTNNSNNQSISTVNSTAIIETNKQKSSNDSNTVYNPKAIKHIVKEEKIIEEEDLNINVKDIEDKEFDEMLTNIKNKKKTSVSNQDNPFQNSATFNEEKVNPNRQSVQAQFKPLVKVNNKTNTDKPIEPKNTNNTADLIQTDFTCGGKAVSYQPDAKTLKLMEEMAKDGDYIDDLDSSLKSQEEPINPKSLPQIEPNQLLKKKKRTYAESNKDQLDSRMNNNSKQLLQKQFKHGYKVEKITKDKSSLQIKKPALKAIMFSLTTISQCEFYCLCECLNPECIICQGSMIINESNFVLGFYISQGHINFLCKYPKDIEDDNTVKSMILSHLENPTITYKDDKIKERVMKISLFFTYQFRLLSWKQYVLDLYKEIDQGNLFDTRAISAVYNNLSKKYKTIIIDERRSFLMKVSEKDAGININMILLLIDINHDEKGNYYTLELSDGYKSIYSIIESTNPIHGLIEKNILYIGMKLNIGLAKVSKVTEDFNVFITIHYNALSKADWELKLGPIKNQSYLIKNIANILTEGGDISMISVMIYKKYDYYVTDLDSKEKYSRAKYDKIIQDSIEDNQENKEDSLFEDNINQKKFVSVYSEKIKKKKEESRALSVGVKLGQNILYHFRLISVDSLSYYDFMNNNEKVIQKYKIHPNSYPVLTSENNELLKAKILERKCIIDFSVKNLSIFEELISGNVYRLMLLNITKEKSQSKNTHAHSKFNDVYLRANDSLRFIEEKYPNDFKKDKLYQEMINQISLNISRPNGLSNIDICKYLHKEKFNCNKNSYEEYSLFAGYLNKKAIISPIVKDDQKKDIIYYFFGSLKEMIVLVKVHNNNFFDTSLFLGNSTGHNDTKKPCKIIQWDNIKFTNTCYYDKETNKILPLTGEKTGKDIHNIIICVETHNHTTLKMVTKGEDYRDMQKKIDNDKIYSLDTLNSIKLLL